ncbi:MAG TPA: zf-TFIIB domain-containing protein [Vicinamibacterales bacterium]|nr:zf-TFIIB domain-containing protein [Vicinamibacterales bacterium]
MRDIARQGPRGPLETRWPCPVCVGVMMEKTRIDAGTRSITLDYCPRCGGLWFDRGEVGQLSAQRHNAVHHLIIDPAKRVNPPCQGCGTPLDRNEEKCRVCRRRNVLACPVCDETMERRAHSGLVLDLCKRCHGVWFDNAELSAIWQLKLAEARGLTRRGGRGSEAAAIGGDVLLNAMFWTPDLVLYGGMAAGHAAGAAVEVVGSAAGGVFEAVMEIIAGLFE